MAQKPLNESISVHVDMCLSAEDVLDSCNFRDEEDDCTYYYTVENARDPKDGVLDVQVLKKKGELRVGCV